MLCFLMCIASALGRRKDTLWTTVDVLPIGPEFSYVVQKLEQRIWSSAWRPRRSQNRPVRPKAELDWYNLMKWRLWRGCWLKYGLRNSGRSGRKPSALCSGRRKMKSLREVGRREGSALPRVWGRQAQHTRTRSTSATRSDIFCVSACGGSHAQLEIIYKIRCHGHALGTRNTTVIYDVAQTSVRSVCVFLSSFIIDLARGPTCRVGMTEKI